MPKNQAVRLCPWCEEPYEGASCECGHYPIAVTPEARAALDAGRLPVFIVDDAEEPA